MDFISPKKVNKRAMSQIKVWTNYAPLQSDQRIPDEKNSHHFHGYYEL